MASQFDEIVPRRGTNSIKYDFARERGMPEGLLPMWVADMDFRCPPEVTERLVEVARHGIFGYSDAKEGYFQALEGWFSRRFEMEIKSPWLVKLPGVVFGLAAAIRAFTQPGDPVVIQTPVYYPFSGCVLGNGRRLVDSPLVERHGKYEIDFVDLDRKIAKSGAKLMILCSPHNPVGRVWSKDELSRLGRICLTRGCVIVSDEIHQDFVFGGRKHHVLTQVDPAFEAIAVLLTAPSKTFNLAGLHMANALIPNPALKKLFSDEVSRSGMSQMSVMGLAACQTAYERGEAWLDELVKYLEGNLALAKKRFAGPLAPLRLVECEGTYLLWMDFRPLGLSESDISRLIVEKAKLWLDPGAMFGPGGAGFQRLNMACPRSVLEEALDRLAKAISR